MAKRGGVSARNYVLHIPRVFGDGLCRTLCGLAANRVNCFADDFDADRNSGTDTCCSRCAVIRRMRHEKQVSK